MSRLVTGGGFPGLAVTTAVGHTEVEALPGPGLSGYVEAVSAALGLSPAGAGSEVADVATAYIALTVRSPVFPGRDLMLSWTDTEGWVLATEPVRPGQLPVVLACLRGDVLPAPSVVADFVGRVLGGGLPDRGPPRWSGAVRLAARLGGYRRTPQTDSPGARVLDGPRPRAAPGGRAGR